MTTCLVAASADGYAASTVLPSGFSVGAGAGSVSAPSPTTMTIHQTTDKAVFNWSSFSISSGAGVVFQQPGGGSIALNRVRGPASQIDGSLTANGQVWIVNPNGVFFGSGSQVNVGGLLATTADIRNQDFLAGNYSFSGATGAAIVNRGEIRAASGGSAVLAGTHVRNDGLIQADLGTVQLAAGKSFALDLAGDKLIRFQVTAAVGQSSAPGDALISNTGTLRADGGRVLLTARAAKSVVDNVINTTGIVEATSANMVNGEIVLDGGNAGTVRVAGRLDASGEEVGETGGKVSVLGDQIALAARAAVDISGMNGGGTALIGTAHGSGLRNASTTLVAGGAVINANALIHGDGGTVVLRSDRSTNFAGSISARGGPAGGNGGFIETSSRSGLGVGATARANTSTLASRRGTWLLGARDIVVQAGGGAGSSTGGLAVDAAPIGKSDSIVKLQATRDIFVNASIARSNAGVGLDLQAGRTISLGADIATTGGEIAFAGPVKLAGTGASTPTSVTIDSTNAGAARGGAGVVFADTVDGSFARRQSLTVAAGTAGNISFDRTVGGARALSSLTASGGSISLASVTTSGAQTYTGATTLAPGATLTTSGGAVLFNSGVTLGASGNSGTLATVDTTNHGTAAAGGGIRFLGTLGADAFRLNDLWLMAGRSGDIIFDGVVSNIGALTVASAENVRMNALDGAAPAFGVRSLSIKAVGNVSAVGSISTDGLSDSSGDLQNAGNITIAAGEDVSLGSAKSLFTGVSAHGGDATLVGPVVAGNGGAVSITGGTIELPAGFSTRGGNAIPAINTFPLPDSTSDGGNGGSVILRATGGRVSIGDPALVSLATSHGGNTRSGVGHTSGAGGAISITGTSIGLATESLDASGGSGLQSGLTSGGKGGSIALSATAGDITSPIGINRPVTSAGGDGGGPGNAVDGGTISLSATGNINLPGSTISSAGGFAFGSGNGGSAGPVTLRTRSGDVTAGSIFAFGNGSNGGGFDGSGGPVVIGSGGAVTISGRIFSNSALGHGPLFGVFSADASSNALVSAPSGLEPPHAGAVTINARGIVRIGPPAPGLPSISSENFGTGADGPINITGSSIFLPTAAIADINSHIPNTGGTITLTATDPVNGSVTVGSLAGRTVRVAAPRQVTISNATLATEGDIVVHGGSVTLNGTLKTDAGTIFVTSSGPIQLTEFVTAVGGDVTFVSAGGTGIIITNALVKALNNPVDRSTDGTVSITGAVTLNGTATAGTGRTVSLRGPP